jgi:hypothetical protein
LPSFLHCTHIAVSAVEVSLDVIIAQIAPFHHTAFVGMSRLTDWLSGSGGTGGTIHIIEPFLANHASFERQSRCPLEPVLGGSPVSVYP